MNNSISNVILFVCSNSNASIEPLKLVRYYNIPLQIVKLDTQKARNKAKKGKYFQINSVPSLVVIYQDGTLQMFIGKEKIVNWIQQLVSSKINEPTQDYNQNDEYQETRLEGYTKPKKSKKKKNKRKHKKPKKLEYPSSEDEDEDDDFIIVSTYEEEQPIDNYNSNLSIHQSSNKKDKMKDIKQIAEKMKREREQTWMYADTNNNYSQ